MLRGAWFGLVALALSAAVFSAEPASEAAEEQVEEAAETEAASADETGEADVDAAVAEEIRAAEEAAANAAPADSNEPFVPTVQISEDLSVSFPVDI